MRDGDGVEGGGDRLDELLGASLGGDLSAEESRELEALLAADPAAAEEHRALQGVVAALRRAGPAAWEEQEPPASLGARVVPIDRPRRSGPPRWAVAPIAAAAAVALLVGGGLGWTVRGPGDAEERPTGPAGELGAYEDIAFTGAPAGVEVDASVVAHTWGTETVFDEIDGLQAGRTYDVVLVDAGGTEVAAGSFLAVEGAVTCRMTSAVLRERVAAVSVREQGGREVMVSELPATA